MRYAAAPRVVRTSLLCLVLGALLVGCLKLKSQRPAGGLAELRTKKEIEPHPAPAMPGQNVSAIKVDTIGYPAGWTKLAVFNVEPRGAVIRDASGKAVYTMTDASSKKLGVDRSSGDPVWQVDFTPFDRSGRYTIEVGGQKSEPFTIGDEVYRQALVAGLKYFYFQRCRTKLEKPFAVWENDAYLRPGVCHAHDQIAWDVADYPDKKRRWKPDAGWHDAGNFEMYVPSTAPTAQALLMAYESHPELFADGDLNLPESGNGVPDILDEAQWGLRWVLSMQDPSGGFHNREAVMDWGEPGPADADKKAHWISGVGTASTGKGCAALAVAARVYARFDKPFAERAESAARLAWKFLEEHPERITVAVKESKQPLWDDGEEYKTETGSRLLAAAEMWRSFRVEGALARAKSLLSDPETQPEKFIAGAWVNMARWGLMTLALDAETPQEVRQTATERLVAAAASLREQIEQRDGYRCASRFEDYYWGHDSNLLERAHLLSVVNRLDPAQAFAREAARDQWHWILGRNPNGFSMVTRVGHGPTRYYHLEWGQKQPPPPGCLVGGPNGKEGAFLAPGTPAKALLWDNPDPIPGCTTPAHSLWQSDQQALWAGGFLRKDHWDVGWWVVTEGDIYYNANLVLVAAEMQTNY
jgi:endoglucanase